MSVPAANPERTRFGVRHASDRRWVAEVDGLLLWPGDASALLVLAHGAGAGMLQPNLTRISEALAASGVATLRFNFPFMQAGRKRVDDTMTAVSTCTCALEHAHALLQARRPLPLFAGGHSFGARMMTHAAAAADAAGVLTGVCGLVLLAFPLHAAGKPSIRRAEHLNAVSLPSLYVSGTRDALAEWQLLNQCLQPLPNARLCGLHDADHGYVARQRERAGRLPVLDELVSIVSDWLRASAR